MTINSKATLTSLILLIVSHANAQGIMERFQMGVFGGINRSLVSAKTNNSILEGNAVSGTKTYGSFMQNSGMQVGFLLRFDVLPTLTISYEPNYQTNSFAYTNNYAWIGQEAFSQEIQYTHAMQKIEHPLYIELKKCFGSIEPYAKAGGFFNSVLGANTTVMLTETQGSFSGNQTNENSQTISSANLFPSSQYGLSAGVGIRYKVAGFAFGLDFTYRMPLSDMNNTGTLFANQELVGGYYGTMDELSFHNFALSLQILASLSKSSGGGGNGGRVGRRGAVPCPTGF